MSEKTDQRLRLTLRQLEVFAATARTGSTRAAAGLVARSQSAASAALAELEATLGVALFDRIGRRLLLNENGRALLSSATSLVEQATELEAMFTASHVAPLRLASSFTIGEYLLPELIADWKKLHPHGQIRVDIANTRDVLDAVAGFDVDVGFIEGTGSHPDLLVKRWRDDELVVVGAPDHPMASQRATARRLAQAMWIMRERGSGTREAADRWLTMHVGQIDVELELGSNMAVVRAVASGLGLGCLSSLAVADALAHGSLVELRTSAPRARRSLAIAVHKRKRLGSAAGDFVAHCLARGTKNRRRAEELVGQR